MNVTYRGWQPDTFTLRKGVPVKWVIDGQQLTSCNKAIQVPKLGLEFDIKPGLQTIEFTPTESGTIPWSCWMGMIPGKFIVLEGEEPKPAETPPAVQAVVQSTTSTVPKAAPTSTTVKTDSGEYQTIRMNVTAGGWQPNKFLLKTGVPVKWVIDGQEINGCNRAIKVPSLGLQFDIKPGLQTIEFTPTESGTIPWSCWMGMIKGTFVVKDDADAGNQRQVQAELDKVQLPAGGGSCGMMRGGGGGCSCGMM